MIDRRPYRMTNFQRGLYRHYENARRKEDGRHDHATSRALPLNIDGITRILAFDEKRNDGEGFVSGDLAWGEQQLLRVFAAVDDQGEKGVMCVIIDRLYGTFEFHHLYRDGQRSGSGPRKLAEMFRTDGQPYVLAIFRLLELLEAGPRLGYNSYHYDFIVQALYRPEGFGFPKFAREAGRKLLETYRANPPTTTAGVPEGLEQDAWYARGFRDANRPLDENLYFWVGRAMLLAQPFWQDHAVKVTCENGGYGRIAPEYVYYIGGMWVSEHDRFFKIDDAFAEQILKHVVRRFNDTPQKMQEHLATIE